MSISLRATPSWDAGVGINRSLVVNGGFRSGGLGDRLRYQHEQTAEALLNVTSEVNANRPATPGHQ